jgi:hypothetical protein
MDVMTGAADVITSPLPSLPSSPELSVVPSSAVAASPLLLLDEDAVAAAAPAGGGILMTSGSSSTGFTGSVANTSAASSGDNSVMSIPFTPPPYNDVAAGGCAGKFFGSAVFGCFGTADAAAVAVVPAAVMSVAVSTSNITAWPVLGPRRYTAVPTRPAAATIAVTFTHVRSPDDDGVDDDEVVVAPRVPRDAIRGVSSSIGPSMWPMRSGLTSSPSH